MYDETNTPHGAEFQDYSRPVFSNYIRDLPPGVARRAIFTVAIGPGDDDKRTHEAASVGGCEGGGVCAIGGAL
jgi:hypothetical protein